MDMVAPEDRGSVLPRLRRIVEAGQADFEVRHCRKDGSILALQVRARRVDWHGQTAILNVQTDLTERKRAEAERLLLTSAIEQAAEVVVITDTQATIQYVNPAFTQTTGYTSEEAIGQNPRILQSGTHDAAFYRRLWDTLAAGQSWRGRFVNMRKSGALYTEDAAISPVRDAAGAIVNYVAVKRDITHELGLESQLRQSQKMEAVGRLAGGVAHDFNNMLQTILGTTEILLSDTAPEDPRTADLNDILAAARRSADLTRQLLAFARKQTIAPVVLDLNDTVADMFKMLRRLIGEDTNLVWKPAADLGPVKMDPSQLDQILANLAVNARDAIAGVGRITIETENAEFDTDYCQTHPEAVPGSYVMLAVSDDGCGMDKAPQATLARPPTGTETVLLVEDEASLLRVARRLLEGLGYTVLAAQGPNEALRLAGEYQGEIHLLLTDVVMPGMSGRDLHDRLSAAHPATKCLFMSGYTANAIAHHDVLEDGLHFIQKPFSKAALAVKLREVLRA
jgi:PAS domain S-box-containing protein